MEMREREVLIALRRIVRAAEQSSRELTQRTGLSPSQAVTLQIIQREGRTDARTLAMSAKVSQASITAILDRLEGDSLILRDRDPNDRRRASVALTQAAHATLNDLPETEQSQFLERFSRLEDWEQTGLVAALERLVVLLNGK